MFWLALNVLRDFVQLATHTDTKCAVLCLRFKAAVFREGFMHPFGGTAFDELHCFGDGHGCGQGEQNMNMVLDAANFNGLHFMLAGDAAKEGPKSFAQGRGDHGTAFLGAEHAMIIGGDVGHAGYSAVPSGLGQGRI